MTMLANKLEKSLKMGTKCVENLPNLLKMGSKEGHKLFRWGKATTT
jgi:hypothetical protein